MGLFRKKPKDGDVVDMHARSPNTGLRYKDIALLGQMAKGGADLAQPRHVLYYLYFPTADGAEAAAAAAREAGYTAEVRNPMPEYPGQWTLVCERPDAVLSVEYVRSADDLFQGLADRLGGDFDGWEASM